MNAKVLVAAPIHPILTAGLKEKGYELLFAEDINQQKAFQLIDGCEGVITSTRLQLNKELLDAAPALKWIGRMGSGMEVIDVDAATSRGIRCFSSPEGNCNAVGEHALGLLLGLTKKIVSSNEEVRNGKWIREENRGIELEGKTVGIIGLGHTGRAFAKKLSGFDVRLIAYDKYDKSPFGEVVHGDDLEMIFSEADVVSFHVPLNRETTHFFSSDFLERMRKPFILINTSRGAVADTAAIYKGLKEGKVVAAGLDVLEEEPLEKMNPALREMVRDMSGLSQVIITPHIAGYSKEALYKMSKTLLERIVILQ